MPYVIGSSSWPLPLHLFTTASINNHLNTIKHHHNPKLIFHSYTSLLSYPSSISFNLSIQSPFSFIPRSCFASNTSALRSPETKGDAGKLRAKHFADRIRATPSVERCNFVHSMVEKDGEIKNIGYFNDLIMGLVMSEEFDLAFQLFDEMPVLGLLPDSWTYCILIRCCCKKNEADVGRKFLDSMIENELQLDVVTLTMLVNSFCRRGKIQRAFEVIEMMGRVGCNPNVHTYNCVLKGLCFVGRVEEAYELLVSLKSNEEYSPDIYSYTCVMDGLCKVGRSDEAMELLEEARSVGLTPNVITYNTLFNGYCKEGKPRNGIRLLKQMKEIGCVPDYVSYSTLLHGLLKWDHCKAALRVYKEMVEVGFKVDERMMNTLLRRLCRKSWEEEGLVQVVDQVFNQIKSWDYSVFPDTYCLLSHAFCIGKEVDKALDVVCEMARAGSLPRMVTINRIIRGFCEEERIGEALSVLVLLCGTGRIPSKISYNILIDEFNRQGDAHGASHVFGAALKLGVIPHRMPLCIQRSKVERSCTCVAMVPLTVHKR